MGASRAGFSPFVAPTKWIILRAQVRPGVCGIVECKCVCASMFIYSALSSADRSVSRPLPAPVPDLDLSSSGGM